MDHYTGKQGKWISIQAKMDHDTGKMDQRKPLVSACLPQARSWQCLNSYLPFFLCFFFNERLLSVSSGDEP